MYPKFRTLRFPYIFYQNPKMAACSHSQILNYDISDGTNKFTNKDDLSFLFCITFLFLFNISIKLCRNKENFKINV